jgi:Zn-dependent M16 (insulinase) family peptidase
VSVDWVDIHIEGSENFLIHELPTNGISYVNLLWNTASVPEKLLPYINLFSFLIPTNPENCEFICHEGNDGFTPVWMVRVKTLEEFIGEFIFDLEFFLDCKIPQDKNIAKRLINRQLIDMKRKFLTCGHDVAVLRAASYFSPADAYREKVSGWDAYFYLKERLEGDDDEFLAEWKAAKKFIFNKNNLTICAAGLSKDNIKLFSQLMKNDIGFAGADRIKNFPVNAAPREGLKTESEQINIALGFEIAPYSSVWAVLAKLLTNDYLKQEIRVKNGAYEAFANVRKNSIILNSYLDTNLDATVNAFLNIPDYINSMRLTRVELDKLITGTMSDILRPLYPENNLLRSTARYFEGVSKEELFREQEEILSCRISDIKKCANVLQNGLSLQLYCAVGNLPKNSGRLSKYLES